MIDTSVLRKTAVNVRATGMGKDCIAGQVLDQAADEIDTMRERILILEKGLQYAKRFAQRNESCDTKYIQDILDGKEPD